MAPPETIEFEGKTIALWTYDALERLSKANLKQRALNLRDQIGEARLMPLRTSAQPASLIRWQLVAQCSLCEAVGLDFSLKDFGAPTEIGEAEEQNVYFGAHDKGSRPPTRSAPEPLSAPFATMPPPPPAAPAAPRMEYEYSAPHAAQDSMPSTPTDAMRDKSYSDAMEGARRARMRNEGSLVLGGDWGVAPSPRPPSSAGRSAPAPYLPVHGGGGLGPQGESPRGPGAPVGGYQHYSEVEQRPGSAASMAASEESAAARIRIKARNQGSFAFG